jgi:hypothetical protein
VSHLPALKKLTSTLLCPSAHLLSLLPCGHEAY